MTHHSKVSDDVFKKIASGERQIEPRLNDPAHRQIRLGDLIVFANRTTNREIVAKVVGVLRYDTFNKLFSAFPLSYFGAESVDELTRQVAGWYTPASQVQHGVLGVKLHILKGKKDFGVRGN